MRGVVLAIVLSPVAIDEREVPGEPEPVPPLVLRIRLPRSHFELIPLWEGPVPAILIPREWPPLEPLPVEP